MREQRMGNTLRTRVTATLLTICMLLTLLPTAALADTPAEAKWSTDSGGTWARGQFSDAVSAVTTAGGGGITLLSDVTGSAGVTFSTEGTYTLDLGNYMLAADAGATALTVSAAADLTICGSGSVTGGNLGYSMSTDDGRAVVVNGGALTVRDTVSLVGGVGDIIGTDAVSASGGRITVTDSARLTGGPGPVLGNGFGLNAKNTAVVISGNSAVTGSPDQHGVFMEGGSVHISGTPTIGGGVGSYDSSIGLYVNSAAATVLGGIFTGDDNGLCVQGTSTVALSGGTFTGGENSVWIETQTVLTLADLLADGHTFRYTDSDAVVPDLTKKNITASVKVTPDTHSVTFYDGDTAFGGDTPQKPQTIVKGAKAEQPDDPTKAGFIFSQWVTEKDGATAFSFETPITADTKVYAAWVALNTGIPDEITASSVLLHGAVSTDVGVSAMGFRWWQVGGEGKTTVEATPAAAFSAAVGGLTPDTEYAYETVATIAGKVHAGSTAYFRTAKESPPTGGIDVDVIGPDNTSLAVTVSIEAGNTVLAAQSGNATKDAPFSASFTALPDGFYNIVVRTSSYTETRLVEVAGGAMETQSFTIPSGALSSVVKIKTPDTPKVAVDQLKNVITLQEEQEAAAGTKSVEARLEVEKQSENPTDGAQAAIRAKAGNQTIAAFLDLSLLKTTAVLATNAVTTDNIGESNRVVLEIAVPFDTSGKNNCAVYRHHDDQANALTPLSARPVAPFEDGTYFVGSGYLFIYAQKFSTYAVAYDTPSSGGSVTTYTITATAGEGGSISPNGKVRVNYGGKKTFTITPEEGYEIADVLVDGKSVGAVSRYAFEWVKAAHTIAASFQKADDRVVWNPFEDVHEDDWFHDSVKYIYENKLMVGTSETTFSPYWDTSRGMIVTILWRMEGEPNATAAAAFPDVAADQYYTEAVAWGAEKGIVKGYDNGNYGPADPITREQLAAILWRYAQYKDWDVSIGENTNILSYLDYPQISEYAIPALQWAVGAEIISGKGGGILAPKGNATRTETAAMLERFLKNKGQ